MNYTSGTHYRMIKNLSGGRGVVSERSRMAAKHRVAQTNIHDLKNRESGDKSAGSQKSTSKSEITSLIRDLKSYSKIATTSGEKLREIGEKLTATGKTTFFGNAEMSGATKAIVHRVKDFVNAYNTELSALTKLGGEENLEFVSKMKKYASDNESVLKEVGITVLKDGSLNIDNTKMDAATLENLKKAFNGESSFAGKVTALTEGIVSNVNTKLKSNMQILVNKMMNQAGAGTELPKGGSRKHSRYNYGSSGKYYSRRV